MSRYTFTFCHTKVWGIEDKLPELFKSLQVTDGSVLALLAHEGLLFIGTQGGDIKVFF